MKDYLFKFGNYIFPMKYIAKNGYVTAPNQRQDLDPYTDATGETHRYPVDHTKTYIEITTLDIPWDVMDEITEGISSNYIDFLHRDAFCEYYNTESRKWETGHFYLDPSVKFQIEKFGKKYSGMTWIFTEY